MLSRQSGLYQAGASVGNYVDDRLLEGNGRCEPREPLDLADVGNAAQHVLEAHGISVLIAQELDRGITACCIAHRCRQIADPNLARGADIEDFSYGGRSVYQPDDRLDCVIDVTEASALLSC